ncbi:MAG: HAD-IA family hydrolase [Pseudomonadales bacterium]|nr:HAD-IA family hydrolase [Pseudomonadales bacterium]
MKPNKPLQSSLQQLSRPAGVIFDLDGTLLDTEPLYTIATQKVLDPFGATFTAELKQRCLGGDSRISAKIVIDHCNLPLSVSEFLANREVYLNQLFLNSPDMPGAENFITGLSKAAIPMGLATSSHQHLCDLKLKSKPWRYNLKEIICGDHADLERSKPNPDIYLLCAKKLKLPAEKCLAFEDSPTGVQAAVAAGMTVIGVNSPYVQVGALTGTLFTIDSYAELSATLSAWTDSPD